MSENIAFKLADKVREMTSLEYEVFKFLREREMFEGSYVDLMRAMEKPEYYQSSVRKAVIRLQDYFHIVCIIKRDISPKKEGGRATHPMKCCYLVEDWISGITESEGE